MSAPQLGLDWNVPPHAESLDMRYARFLAEYPRAIHDLAEIARELLASGETRLSAKFLIEIARYQHIIRRTPGERYAVNNSYSSRIARTLEALFPVEFAGKFETREMHS